MGCQGRRRSQPRAVTDGDQPSKPLPVTAANQDSGAAWASVGLPNLATVDARVDPGNDQGKARHHVQAFDPGRRQIFADAAGQLFGYPNRRPARDRAVQRTADDGAGRHDDAPTPQVWGSQKTVKFDVLTTGTTFGAGVATASNDPVTHNTLSADQKLYGPLHVTTAVTDFGQPTASKSISAGLKLNW